MKAFLYAPFLLLLGSCATLFNDIVQPVKITADKRIANLRIDSVKPIEENREFYVLRNKKPLVLTITVDSTEQTFKIKSHSSLAYWLNIPYNYGLGMLVDRKKPERYAYPKYMHLDYNNGKVKLRRFEHVKKGAIDFNFSLPHINTYFIKPDTGYRRLFGFFGIELGLDYYYRDRHFVSVNVGRAINSWVPVPAPVRYPRGYQFCDTRYINLKNNFTAWRFDLGYGVNLSELRWSQAVLSDSDYVTKRSRSLGLGFSLSAHFRFGRHFRLGVLYQPNLLQLNRAPAFVYQHYLSIVFTWKRRLWTPRAGKN